MATRYYGSINCPHCNAVYYRYAGKTTAFPGYGSPIRECPKCHEKFLCLDYHESAISGYNASARYAKEPTFEGTGFGGGIAIIVAFLFWNAHMKTGAFILLGIGVLLLIRAFYIKHNGKRIEERINATRDKSLSEEEAYLSGKGKRELKGEDLDSVRRLENPDYIRYLEIHGVSVPAWFKEKINYKQYLTEVSLEEYYNRIIGLGYPITLRVKAFFEDQL